MIISFHGVDSKVGTTMIAQSAAEALNRKAPQLKILLMHFTNRQNNTFFSVKDATSLDDIYHKFEKGLLTMPEFTTLCHRQGNLYRLLGVRAFYIPNDVFYVYEFGRKLIEFVSSFFDYVVIDTGSNIYFGLTPSALLHSDRNYLVLTQDESALDRYKIIYDAYKELSADGRTIRFDSYILNKYGSGVYDMNYLKKFLCRGETADRNLMTVSSSPKGKYAEIDRKTLLGYSSREFESGIANIVNDMILSNPDDKARSVISQKRIKGIWSVK